MHSVIRVAWCTKALNRWLRFEVPYYQRENARLTRHLYIHIYLYIYSTYTRLYLYISIFHIVCRHTCIHIYIYNFIYIPRHPIVLEKSTPPWFRTSFHENTWNMANRSNFVEIVIFVSFFETYYFLGAPSTNGQKNRTQLERNFAQVERNLKSTTLCKNTLARSFTFLEGDHFFVKRHPKCWNVNCSIRDTFF